MLKTGCYVPNKVKICLLQETYEKCLYLLN